jgi:hypothetical protein
MVAALAPSEHFVSRSGHHAAVSPCAEGGFCSLE